MKKIKSLLNILKTKTNIEKGYSDFEINNFEIKNNICLPLDFKYFLNFTRAFFIDIPSIILNNNTSIEAYGYFNFNIELFNERSELELYEMMEKMEVMENCIRIGNNIYGNQSIFLGVKGSIFGQVYLLNWESNLLELNFKNNIYIDEKGFKVFPKHLVANNFTEFIELLINNLGNTRID